MMRAGQLVERHVKPGAELPACLSACMHSHHPVACGAFGLHFMLCPSALPPSLPLLLVAAVPFLAGGFTVPLQGGARRSSGERGEVGAGAGGGDAHGATQGALLPRPQQVSTAAHPGPSRSSSFGKDSSLSARTAIMVAGL